MSSFENSKQHTDMLIEEKETEQKIELLPKEDKAHKPYVFNFNKSFVSAGFVVDDEGNLAQLRYLKMKEEDFMEEFNPWNKDVKLLERVLDNHDSIMKEGKDETEADIIAVTTKVETRVSIAKFGTKAKEEEKVNQQLESGSNQQQFEELVDNSNNLKQREGGRSKKQNMDQSKDELEKEIEEMWQLMMKQSKWRKMVET